MKIRGTDFVLYPVSDFSRAVAFYRDMLGLRPQICSDEWQWAEFDCGNVTLALHGGQTVASAGSGARVALSVADIDAAWAELTDRGARVFQPLQDYGVCRSFAVLDPDGNVVLLHRRADGTFG
ncbi:MAG TPA: VOC family protein [Opitutaceae bacterium]